MIDEVFPPLRSVQPIPPHKQDEMCSVIAQGEMNEEEAALHCSICLSDYMYAHSFDQEFNEKLQAAYRKRADLWHQKIMKDVDEEPHKDFAAGAKLKFEKLKYLAEIDNPDKYGKKSSTTVDITHTIVHNMKAMTREEAVKILKADPFSLTVPAESSVVTEESSKEYPL